jgi:hypothetical protein
MIKFSFPHFYYDNLSSISLRSSASSDSSGYNVLTGERHKGYKTNSISDIALGVEFFFDEVVEYDHCIVSRLDKLQDMPTLNYIRTQYYNSGISGYANDIVDFAPVQYYDSHNQDTILIKDDKTLNTSDRYMFQAVFTSTATRVFSISKIQIGSFFNFDENPKNFDLKLESNSSRFKTDGNAEHQVQFDLPSRTWTATFEAVTDAKLATFKRRVNQQLYDNQKAYCYLYDSSGRDELLGASLAHVSIESFQYTKIQSNYNLVNLTMREVIG